MLNMTGDILKDVEYILIFELINGAYVFARLCPRSFPSVGRLHYVRPGVLISVPAW